MRNTRAVIAPRLNEGENCITSHSGFANVFITALRPKVATVPDTAFHCVPCTLHGTANLQLQSCFEEILPFDCCESYSRTSNKVEGLPNQHDLSVTRGGTQMLQSGRDMKRWNDRQILHLLSSPWTSVGRASVWSRQEEGVMQVSGLPHARGLGALQNSGLCTTRHVGEWWSVCLWGSEQLTSDWMQP